MATDVPNILGVVIEEKMIEKNVSCTGNLLQIGLRRRGALRAMVDVDVHGVFRKLMIASNVAPDMNTWRFKFHLDTNMRRLRSRKAQQLLNALPFTPDAVVQIGSEFDLSGVRSLRNVPRFSYHDSNLHAYLKGAWRLPHAPRSVARALAYEQEVYDKLTGVMTMTEYLRRSFIDDFHLPEEKVHCVGVGLNFSSLPDVPRQDDGNTFLFVARHLFEQKGGHVVLDAFRRVRRDLPGVRLLLVGQELTLEEEGVQCIGFVDKSTPEGSARMSELYAHASVFVLPSYNEALGNVFLEAMAHGVPCLGADCCAMPEIITGNDAGFVVPPGDSAALADRMLLLLKDDDLRVRLGENGRRAAMQKYNWDVVADRVIRLIHERG